MKRIIIILLVLFSGGYIYCQETDEEILYMAEESLYDENFEYALNLYKEILTENPNDADVNFKTGFCYLNIHNQKDKSISYFEKAIKYYDKKKNEFITPVELNYYLGIAYHVTGDYLKAIDYLDKSLKYAKDYKLIQAQNLISLDITKCKNAIELSSNPESVVLDNMGSEVNTEFNEESPVLMPYQKELFYSSNFDDNTEDDEFVFYKNLYSSENTNNTWFDTKIIENSEKYESDIIPCAVSSDEKNLLLSIDNDLYISSIQSETIGEPELIKGDINSRASEFGACYAFNDKAIIFSSDRKKGYGGRDLYISIKDEKGNWGKAENLGKEINTEYNEDCPFFFNDSILFFSSDGELSMGGYDIVYSILNSDSTWSKIVNIGYPINSEEDDLNFSLYDKGTKGYYSSNKTGTIGKFDLFEVEFNRQDLNYFVLNGTVSPKEISGTVSIYDENLNLLYDNVEIFNSGEFSSNLVKGNPYFLSFSVDGFYPVVRTIEAKQTFTDSLDLKDLLLQYEGVDNLYSLNISNKDLTFKSQLIVENLTKLKDKNLFIDLNCCLNDIIIAEKIKRQLISSGYNDEMININSFYETLENEIIASIYSEGETISELNPNISKSDYYSNTDGYFTIQVGAFKSNINMNSFKNLENINIFYGNDKFARVTVGSFETEKDAEEYLKDIKKLGYKQAFVRPLAYFE